ncbi:MAG: hypothetical protein JO126_05940 [Alphaproteobacteria bacterium]|nr:hypothetical protein [Alphaproteobacteria bacterium]MBV8548978.1 hypothetical protein [Alphaproteobacteria bacterium]
MAQEAQASVTIETSEPNTTEHTGVRKHRRSQPQSTTAGTAKPRQTAQAERTVRTSGPTVVNVNVGASAAASAPTAQPQVTPPAPVTAAAPAPQNINIFAHFTPEEAGRLNKFMDEMNCDLDMQTHVAGAFVAMKHYVGRNGVVESIDLLERMPNLSVQEVCDLTNVMARNPGLMHQLGKITDNGMLQDTADSLMDAASSMDRREFDATAKLLGKLPPEAIKPTVEKLMHARYSMAAHGMSEDDYVGMCDQLAGAANGMAPGDRVQAVQAFIDARPYITNATFGNMVSDSTNPTLLVQDEATLSADAQRGRKDDKKIEDAYMKARADGHYKAGTMTVGPNGVFDYSTSNIWAQNMHYDQDGHPAGVTQGGGTAFVSALGSFIADTGVLFQGLGVYKVGQAASRGLLRDQVNSNNTNSGNTVNSNNTNSNNRTNNSNNTATGQSVVGSGTAGDLNSGGGSIVKGNNGSATASSNNGTSYQAGGDNVLGTKTTTTTTTASGQASVNTGSGSSTGGTDNSNGGINQAGSTGATASGGHDNNHDNGNDVGNNAGNNNGSNFGTGTVSGTTTVTTRTAAGQKVTQGM